MKPALFLDRDGVINTDVEFAYRPDQIEWVDGIFDALKIAREAGYNIFVVTNQSGVARGFYTETDVQNLHRWMQQEFKKRGVFIDEFAYCPHPPSPAASEDKSSSHHISCTCRKPKPGMLLNLMEKYPTDMAKSFLIGDRETDIQAAEAAGIRGYLFKGQGLAELVRTAITSLQA